MSATPGLCLRVEGARLAVPMVQSVFGSKGTCILGMESVKMATEDWMGYDIAKGSPYKWVGMT